MMSRTTTVRTTAMAARTTGEDNEDSKDDISEDDGDNGKGDSNDGRNSDSGGGGEIGGEVGGEVGGVDGGKVTFCSDLSPPLLKLPTAIGDPSPPIACRSQSNENTETSTLPPKRNFRQLPAVFPPPNCHHFHPQPSILAISFTTRNPSLNRASFQTKQVLLKSTTLKN